MALTAEKLVSEWSNERVIEWIASLNIFKNNDQIPNWKIYFSDPGLTGLRLLQLNQITIGQYLSKFRQPQITQFLTELNTLNTEETRYQNILSKFNTLKAKILHKLKRIRDTKSIQYCRSLRRSTWSLLCELGFTNISKSKVNAFMTELSTLMINVLPIFSQHLQTTNLLQYRSIQKMLWCLCDIIGYPEIISHETWLKSGFIKNMMDKIQDNKYECKTKRDLLNCIANLASAICKDEALTGIFKEFDIICVMYEYVRNCVVEYNPASAINNDISPYKMKNKINYCNLLFPFRVILFCADTNNDDKLEWMIYNTKAIYLLLMEYDYALEHKLLSHGDSVFFYADTWDRSLCVNKLYDMKNKKLQKLLLKEDGYNIIHYLFRSLFFEEKTVKEQTILYDNVCECIYKISLDLENNLHILFKYQFECLGKNRQDLWTKLSWIMKNKNFPKSSAFTRLLQNNIQDYYIDILNDSELKIDFPDDIFTEIVSFIW